MSQPITGCGQVRERFDSMSDNDGDMSQIFILYGSNTRTCEILAQRLAANVKSCGYRSTVKDMDSAVNRLSKDVPTVIVTASYEGQPPDNAAQFVA